MVMRALIGIVTSLTSTKHDIISCVALNRIVGSSNVCRPYHSDISCFPTVTVLTVISLLVILIITAQYVICTLVHK